MSRSDIDLEGDLAIPLENALTAARLLEEWFQDRCRTPIHPLGYLGMTDDERQTLAFGISDLRERLRVLDEQISGPCGLSPR